MPINSSIGDGSISKIYYGEFSSPNIGTLYSINVDFCPDFLLILPDPENINNNRGFYSIINGSVVNWNKNGGLTYYATVTITEDGFTYKATDVTESLSGPNHIFIAAKY